MRICAWCHGGIHETARRDARFCSQSCRQASHRFTRLAVARRRASRPMRFAYADPPYPGLAGYYRDHPDFAGEVDHSRLVEQLTTGYPDGWALSTSARALPFVLSLLTTAHVSVSVAAWFRRRRPNTTARRPVSSWEPVIVCGGRELSRAAAAHGCRYDSLIGLGGPRTTDPGRVLGAKPAEFAYWMFDLLGALPGDQLDDLFPGSGGISRAWAHYVSLDVEHDTSPRGERDTSPPAIRDASPEYSHDG